MNDDTVPRTKIVNRFLTVHVLGVVALIQSLASVETVRATSIQIDLGSAPVLSRDLTVSFPDLKGTSLSGQNLSLDFVFAGPQFVRVFSVTGSDFEVSIKLQTNSPGNPGFLDGTGFISDNLGNPLEPPQILGSASSSDGSMLVGLFPLFPGAGAPNRPFDFFSVHFNLALPSNASFEVTGGEFRLLDSGFGGPFGIGPGVPNDIVGEGTDTIYLLGLSLAGLLAARVKSIDPLIKPLHFRKQV